MRPPPSPVDPRSHRPRDRDGQLKPDRRRRSAVGRCRPHPARPDAAGLVARGGANSPREPPRDGAPDAVGDRERRPARPRTPRSRTGRRVPPRSAAADETASAPRSVAGDFPMMRVGYADPPYLGCCDFYDHDHGADGCCWDAPETHWRLIDRLCDEFPDGWALSASAVSLPTLLTRQLGDDVRIGVWVKPFAVFL